MPRTPARRPVRKHRDIGDRCVECGRDTSLGSGLFVNRVPAEVDDGSGGTVEGYYCPECLEDIEAELEAHGEEFDTGPRRNPAPPWGSGFSRRRRWGPMLASGQVVCACPCGCAGSAQARSSRCAPCNTERHPHPVGNVCRCDCGCENYSHESLCHPCGQEEDHA